MEAMIFRWLILNRIADARCGIAQISALQSRRLLSRCFEAEAVAAPSKMELDAAAALIPTFNRTVSDFSGVHHGLLPLSAHSFRIRMCMLLKNLVVYSISKKEK